MIKWVMVRAKKKNKRERVVNEKVGKRGIGLSIMFAGACGEKERGGGRDEKKWNCFFFPQKGCLRRGWVWGGGGGVQG